ncbi:unnamed protein product [Closterium sp. NIES-54]
MRLYSEAPQKSFSLTLSLIPAPSIPAPSIPPPSIPAPSIPDPSILPEKTADADFVYAPLTFLAPTDVAFFRALFRSRHAMSRKVALFHILVDLYSLKKLKAVPDRNGLFPLLFFSSLGSSSDKYVLVKHSVRPNLIFNPGTKVAFSAWNASTLFWAQVDTRRLFEGSFVKAHQLDRVLLP